MKMEFHDGLNFNGDSQSEVTLDVLGCLNGNDDDTPTTNGSGKINGQKLNGKKVNGKKVNGFANGFANGQKQVNGFAKGVSQQVRDNININDKSFDTKRVINADDEDQQVPATFIADTKLPTTFGQFRLRAYRHESTSNEFTGNEPCVIYSEDKPPFGKDGNFLESVPVRIHDQCLTSEVFGSQRCDCKQQLRMAMEFIQHNGGAVIYMPQEGRGIGIANKVAAYALQDTGMDTVDGNLHLGLPEDARQYGCVPSMLHDMKIASIRLLTNNPRKVHRLGALGVKITQTEPMVVEETNPYNHKYLVAKHERMNHTNLSPLINGSMMPRRKQQQQTTMSHATDGQRTVENALHVSLSTEEELMQVPTNGEETTTATTDGATAGEDGYCFGRQSVEDAIAAIQEGKMVVVVDDMDRENEGDFIMAAEACTPEDMATIVRYSSGVICVGMEGTRMDELKLPAMVSNNEDPKGTAFSVSVDATKEHGITTGISATDRAKSVRMLANPNTFPTDFSRPGHIFPLRAKEGGVLARDGHTEAAVDLSILAGRGRAGLLCEIVSEENPVEMARLPELKRFCKKHGYVLTSIVDIAQFRRETERIADFE
eukprot:CAMPEP_0113624706 /NCGR_PEP_ID=MMETSP0017_2-20120614/12744_1 /TAXON_ID=2856 /ORGANISM="Cylindrotheca closterium" /LENGTH=598 /DNA_ID=CAMNT_0000534761 /DNA_START=573 /DNA_END=2369 /DNA_ORIENTATION=+ /assembly_acc=CAM_ASM_000147